MARGYDGQLLKPDDAADRPESATRDLADAVAAPSTSAAGAGASGAGSGRR